MFSNFFKAKPIPMPTKPVELTPAVQHEKAKALISNALGMFTTAISSINVANKCLEDAANKRKAEISKLQLDLESAKQHHNDMSAEIDKNNTLKEKLEQFVV